MKLRANMQVAGPISPRLQNGIPCIQEMISGWFPEFRPIRILTMPEADATPQTDSTASQRGAACFFSGGVDSFYSTLKHLDEIDTLLLIHGFDMDLDAFELRQMVSGELRKAAAALGKRLIEVETNMRTLTDQYAHWGYQQHGAALASVALLLAPQLSRVYIPSSFAADQLLPWGSHPDLDPLWSTEDVDLVHDGLECTRVQKVGAIVNSEIAMRHLRVCWENRESTYNCGRCEKCLRTLINLRVVGAEGRCQTFDRPLNLWAISRMLIWQESTRLFVQENLDALRARGGDPVLEKALCDALAQRYYRGPWKVVRQAWWKVKHSLR